MSIWKRTLLFLSVFLLVLVAVCFAVVVLMNWFAARGDRYKKRI